jgi:hypothetical protein
MTDDFGKDERAFWRMAVIKTLGFIGVLLAVGVLAIILTIHNVKAAPIAEGGGNGVLVVLTDEPCTLSAVANLKGRATWTENGKTHEGCYAPSPAGVIMFYFGDRTVVAIPNSAFQRVHGV